MINSGRPETSAEHDRVQKLEYVLTRKAWSLLNSFYEEIREGVTAYNALGALSLDVMSTGVYRVEEVKHVYLDQLPFTKLRRTAKAGYVALHMISSSYIYDVTTDEKEDVYTVDELDALRLHDSVYEQAIFKIEGQYNRPEVYYGDRIGTKRLTNCNDLQAVSRILEKVESSCWSEFVVNKDSTLASYPCVRGVSEVSQLPHGTSVRYPRPL